MDVANVKVPEVKLPVGNANKESGVAQAEGTARVQLANNVQDPNSSSIKLNRDEVKLVAEELNKFMENLNTNIKFSVHEKTKQVIVQVMDAKEEKVLREFPAHELLDTLAAIREYVGVLLDKKV